MDARAIRYLRQEEQPIPPADVRRLYEGVDWGHNRDEEGIANALAASVAVGAWDGQRLVGFARALSDGRYRAYVEDVMVDPQYRGRGIGERMVAALVESLGPHENVSLFCMPERVAFYRRNGFLPSETQVMMHRRSTDAPRG